MIVEVMMICALTNTAPYYDCDAPKWMIVMYDDMSLNNVPIPKKCQIERVIILGCASYNRLPSVDALYTPIIIISGSNYIDEWGMNTLQHEIKHIKCRCIWEGHN